METTQRKVGGGSAWLGERESQPPTILLVGKTEKKTGDSGYSIQAEKKTQDPPPRPPKNCKCSLYANAALLISHVRIQSHNRKGKKGSAGFSMLLQHPGKGPHESTQNSEQGPLSGEALLGPSRDKRAMSRARRAPDAVARGLDRRARRARAVVVRARDGRDGHCDGEGRLALASVAHLGRDSEVLRARGGLLADGRGAGLGDRVGVGREASGADVDKGGGVDSDVLRVLVEAEGDCGVRDGVRAWSRCV